MKSGRFRVKENAEQRGRALKRAKVRDFSAREVDVECGINRLLLRALLKSLANQRAVDCACKVISELYAATSSIC